MNQYEKHLVDEARKTLQDLIYRLNSPESDMPDVFDALSRLGGQTDLAIVGETPYSDECIRLLIEINEKAMELMRQRS